MNFASSFGFEKLTVKNRLHNGEPARYVGGSRKFATSPEDLWEAITSIDRIPRWFSTVTGELKLGGRYKVEGNAEGEILKCDPPELLHLTWEIHENVSWLNITLEADGPATILSLEHIMLKDDASDAHWAKYGPGAAGVGWDLSFMGMALHIENDGAAIDTKAFEAWMSTEPGKDYIRKCAKDWGAAHIRSGEGKKIAEKMATATANFYAPS